jgi:recombination protein RecA
VEKSGAWFSLGKERIGQGRENSKRFLAENPDAAKDLGAKIREHLATA